MADLFSYYSQHMDAMGSCPHLVFLENDSYVKFRDTLRPKEKGLPPSARLQHAILPKRVDLRLYPTVPFPGRSADPLKPQGMPAPWVSIKSYQGLLNYLYDHEFNFGWKPQGVVLPKTEIEEVARDTKIIAEGMPISAPPVFTMPARVYIHGVELIPLELGEKAGRYGVVTIFEDPLGVLGGY